MNKLKGQTVIDEQLVMLVSLLLIILAVAIIFLFVYHPAEALTPLNLKAIYLKANNTEFINLTVTRAITNPNNVSIYINNITTKISLRSAKFIKYVVVNGSYIYSYSLATNNTTANLFSNNSNRVVLMSYINDKGQKLLLF